MKRLLFVASVLAWTATEGWAGLLVDQSPPNGNSFDITDFRLADDFTLSSVASVNEIGFWYQAQFQTDLAAVTYAVYRDNAGSLATLLQSDTINTPDTSFDPVSGFFFANFVITPISLGGGTYWLELHAGSTLTDASGFTVSWAAAGDNLTNVALENLSLGLPDAPVNASGFDQYAFQLSGTQTPEPGPAALCALGFCAFAFAARRIRTTSTK